MYHFPLRETHQDDYVVVRVQRSPKAYMGVERMLLNWVQLLAFAAMSGIALVSIPGPLSRVFQVIFLPFAAAGLFYRSALRCVFVCFLPHPLCSVYRYYGRVTSLAYLGRTIESRIGSDPLAYTLLIALIIAVILSALLVTLLNNSLL